MKTPIEKIRQILTNHYLNPSLSNRKVAERTQTTHKTVGKVLKLLNQSNGISTLENLKSLSNIDLAEQLGIKKQTKKSRSDYDVKVFEYIHQELKKRDITLRLLHAEHKSEQPDCVSYSHFARKYRKWKKTQKLSMRQIFKAGEQVLVDFCGKTVPIYSRTGEIRQVQVFVGAMGASGYIFAHAVDSQKVEDWLECHIEMFNFFGGVPEQVVTDNLKSAVIVNNKKNLVINQSYASCAEHYDFAINPTRPCKPKDKGLAEVSVQVVQRGILAKLRYQKFFSLAELNEAIMRELDVINYKTTHRFKVSRYVQFMSLDKPVLGPLPLNTFSVKRWFYKRRVNEFYLVNAEGVDYSVPYQYAHMHVDVAIGKNLVEFYYQRVRIACHAIRENGNTAVIDIQHMPKEHQMQYENNPDYLKNWATNFGQSASQWVEARLKNKRNFANNLRGLNKLKSWLADNAYEERFNPACEFALACNFNSCTDLKNIIKTQSYLRFSADSNVPNHDDNHENLRGKAYYHDLIAEQQEKTDA